LITPASLKLRVRGFLLHASFDCCDHCGDLFVCPFTPCSLVVPLVVACERF
jgi:hypothetical protein